MTHDVIILVSYNSLKDLTSVSRRRIDIFKTIERIREIRSQENRYFTFTIINGMS